MSLTKITHAMRVEIRKLRRAKKSWRVIGELLGVSYEAARTAIEPWYREKRSDQRRVDKRASRAPDAPRRGKAEPAANVKRDQALYDPMRDAEWPERDITATWMGDPPPGRRELIERMSGV